MTLFPEGRVTVVAEIGPNHNQSIQNVFDLIDAAKQAGANVIKLQAYTADELVALRGDGPAPEPWGAQGFTMRALYEQAATPLGWFPTLKNYCQSLNIPWFASVFGAESLAAMEAVGCPAYKLAAMEWGNRELREMVEATGKPMVQSCARRSGPRFDAFQDRATDALVCYAPPGYPQTSFNLRSIANGYQGFSYHNHNPDIPALAVALGVRYIEAHIHLENEPSRFEADFALTPRAFAQMVRGIRQAESAL